MKVLVFSDTHFTNKFNVKIYDRLTKLIDSVDLVIINGDFWDGYLIPFEAFLSSAWSKLFPLLKSKNAIYLYGNHDRKSLSDDRVNLFSVKQADQHILRLKNAQLVIEHGHLLCPTAEDVFPKLFNHRIAFQLGTFLIKAGVAIFGRSFLRVFRHGNRVMLKARKNKYPDQYFLLTGHSHFQEYNPKSNFWNSGATYRRFIQYAIVDTAKGSITNFTDALK